MATAKKAAPKKVAAKKSAPKKAVVKKAPAKKAAPKKAAPKKAAPKKLYRWRFTDVEYQQGTAQWAYGYFRGRFISKKKFKRTRRR